MAHSHDTSASIITLQVRVRHNALAIFSYVIFNAMPVSRSIRERMIALKTHTSKSDRQIGEDLSIDHRTVARIWENYQKTGSLSPYHNTKMGRPPKLTIREKSVLVREAKKDPKASAEEVRLAATSIGQRISTVTTKRILSEAGLKSYRPVKKPLLTSKHKKDRLQWARLHQNWTTDDWKKVSDSFSLG